MARLSNPFGFTRGPVTILSTLVYLALLVALLVVHTTVPSPPSSPTPISGINLTEAWLDLQTLTSSYHPYNSHANDAVHSWLLSRIESIVKENEAEAYIFEDNTSNLTYSSEVIAPNPGVSVYFEGTNIIVYIRGKQDDTSKWWLEPAGKPSTRNAVLVNAHYDSVSTGFGSTDDGVGVICVLQLLRFFTTAKNSPKNGVVLLFNNGEEDFLNGANVFSQHPMSKLVSSFLNLEGAGAGGRAALFRSTDEAVTKAYAHSKYPFGSSISADGFNRGLVRSQTDYVIFNGKLGYRGLDVAFIGPRARYHTDQDDSRHTGKSSLWHMLSAAVATSQALTSASLKTNLDPDKVQGNRALWFDMFGQTFAIMRAHTFFALSVSLLVAGPVILLLTVALLYSADKFYLFSGASHVHHPSGEEKIKLYGWRGFFRFPLISLVACAAPIALAFLIFKENQYIAHSSEWAVWSMMISAFVFVAWFFSRAADYTRPSSLTRVYGFSWMWTAWWALLVAAVVFEEQFHLIGLYFILIYAALVWLATWFAYIELFSLPKKATYCQDAAILDDAFPAQAASSSGPEEDSDHPEDNEDEPTERSSLLRRGYHREQEEAGPGTKEADDKNSSVAEPDWSKTQWTFLWLLQILILVPINVIIVGQVSLLLTEGLHQTGQDGSSMFLLYILMAFFTILLFSPLVPILHRFTWHVPIFLLLVLIGTLIYNLTAFPFSMDNRLKLYFQQHIDLEGGNNTVSLMGVSPYTRHALSYLPSSAGQDIACTRAGPTNSSNMHRCSWSGIPPNVASLPSTYFHANKSYSSWLTFNVTRLNNSDSENVARFVLRGKNTRACKIVFDSVPITGFHVDDQAPRDKRFVPVRETGSQEIRLWSRTWGRAWTVDVNWDTPSSLRNVHAGAKSTVHGKVVCLWSDANEKGVIPAFDEAMHYVPDWVAVTKAADGLVEGYKRFEI